MPHTVEIPLSVPEPLLEMVLRITYEEDDLGPIIHRVEIASAVDSDAYTDITRSVLESEQLSGSVSGAIDTIARHESLHTDAQASEARSRVAKAVEEHLYGRPGPS